MKHDHFCQLDNHSRLPSLIGMLMQAQTPDWPSGLASMVVKQLFHKFESQDMVSLIDTNQLK